jgi:ornithine cyclodeaminase/alanine dehydrogenase-like protein (mu-crystallin family)
LVVSRAEVERLLTPLACIAAVEDAFRRLASGSVPAPAILGVHAAQGSFHVKAAQLEADRPYFAVKLNANFPANGPRFGLPTIQGVVALFDAANGALLALLDSISITALRTAAATAVAAKYLAREACDTAFICGCGAQAAAQLRAVLAVRRLKRVYVHDVRPGAAEAFAAQTARELGISPQIAVDLAPAAVSDIIVTCTTSRRAFLRREMVRPGAFIAAVGADHEEKQEIDPQLMAAATVVTDLTAQAAAMGDLHHAIVAGAMSAADVHAELGEVVNASKRGRTDAEETIVFDSTGTGLQDAAAAIAVYRQALEAGAGDRFVFA